MMDEVVDRESGSVCVVDYEEPRPKTWMEGKPQFPMVGPCGGRTVFDYGMSWNLGFSVSR